MQLESKFTIAAPIEKAWEALNNPETVAPCFPGATLTEYEGDSFTGTVKVKLGPISLTYKGKGTYVDRDDAAHKVVIDASGRDSRGNGTAKRHGHRHDGRRRPGQDRGHDGHRHDDHRPAGAVRPRRHLRRRRQDHRPVRVVRGGQAGRPRRRRGGAGGGGRDGPDGGERRRRPGRRGFVGDTQPAVTPPAAPKRRSRRPRRCAARSTPSTCSTPPVRRCSSGSRHWPRCSPPCWRSS